MKYFIVFILATGLLISYGCTDEKPEEPNPVRRKSPTAIASVTHGDTYIKIVYGQPYRHGRDIFGTLVPYGKIWRTGANEATEITTTRDIIFAGKELSAGTYALFSIPQRDSWTVILNSRLGQWGAFDYDAAYDVLRAEVPSYRLQQAIEAFTIRFGEVQANETSIMMSWDSTGVEIPVRFLSGAASSPSSP